MELVTRELCLAGDIGVHGNLFGGTMMSWLDKAAGIEATRLCESNKLVTKKFDCEFFKKIRVGQQVCIYSEVESIGKTSIVINLEVRKYKVHTKEEMLMGKVRAVFVRVDDDGEKRPISTEARASILKIIENKKNEDNTKD